MLPHVHTASTALGTKTCLDLQRSSVLIAKMKSNVRVDAQAISTVTNEDAKGADDGLRAKQLPAGVADLDASQPAVCAIVSLVSSCAQLAQQESSRAGS